MSIMMIAGILAAVLFGGTVLVVLLRDRPHRLAREMYIRECLRTDARKRP